MDYAAQGRYFRKAVAVFAALNLVFFQAMPLGLSEEFTQISNDQAPVISLEAANAENRLDDPAPEMPMNMMDSMMDTGGISIPDMSSNNTAEDSSSNNTVSDEPVVDLPLERHLSVPPMATPENPGVEGYAELLRRNLGTGFDVRIPEGSPNSIVIRNLTEFNNTAQDGMLMSMNVTFNDDSTIQALTTVHFGHAPTVDAKLLYDGIKYILERNAGAVTPAQVLSVMPVAVIRHNRVAGELGIYDGGQLNEVVRVWEDQVMLKGETPPLPTAVQRLMGRYEFLGRAGVAALAEPDQQGLFVLSWAGPGVPAHLSGLELVVSAKGELISIKAESGIDLGLLQDAVQTYWIEHGVALNSDPVEYAWDRFDALCSMRYVTAGDRDDLRFEFAGESWKCYRDASNPAMIHLLRRRDLATMEAELRDRFGEIVAIFPSGTEESFYVRFVISGGGGIAEVSAWGELLAIDSDGTGVEDSKLLFEAVKTFLPGASDFDVIQTALSLSCEEKEGALYLEYGSSYWRFTRDEGTIHKEEVYYPWMESWLEEFEALEWPDVSIAGVSRGDQYYIVTLLKAAGNESKANSMEIMVTPSGINMGGLSRSTIEGDVSRTVLAGAGGQLLFEDFRSVDPSLTDWQILRRIMELDIVSATEDSVVYNLGDQTFLDYKDENGLLAKKDVSEMMASMGSSIDHFFGILEDEYAIWLTKKLKSGGAANEPEETTGPQITVVSRIPENTNHPSIEVVYRVDLGEEKVQEIPLQEGENYMLFIVDRDLSGHVVAVKWLPAVTLDTKPPVVTDVIPPRKITHESKVNVSYKVDGVLKTKSLELQEGLNTGLAIEETDLAGNVATYALPDVFVDTVPPSITDVKTLPTLTNLGKLLLTYREEGVLKEVLLELQEGLNSGLEIKASDVAGNVTTVKLPDITLDTTPPEITIVGEVPRFINSGDGLFVTYTVDAGAEKTVLFGLRPGLNESLFISETDAAGNQTLVRLPPVMFDPGSVIPAEAKDKMLALLKMLLGDDFSVSGYRDSDDLPVTNVWNCSALEEDNPVGNIVFEINEWDGSLTLYQGGMNPGYPDLAPLFEAMKQSDIFASDADALAALVRSSRAMFESGDFVFQRADGSWGHISQAGELSIMPQLSPESFKQKIKARFGEGITIPSFEVAENGVEPYYNGGDPLYMFSLGGFLLREYSAGVKFVLTPEGEFFALEVPGMQDPFLLSKAVLTLVPDADPLGVLEAMTRVSHVTEGSSDMTFDLGGRHYKAFWDGGDRPVVEEVAHPWLEPRISEIKSWFGPGMVVTVGTANESGFYRVNISNGSTEGLGSGKFQWMSFDVFQEGFVPGSFKISYDPEGQVIPGDFAGLLYQGIKNQPGTVSVGDALRKMTQLTDVRSGKMCTFCGEGVRFVDRGKAWVFRAPSLRYSEQSAAGVVPVSVTETSTSGQPLFSQAGEAVPVSSAAPASSFPKTSPYKDPFSAVDIYVPAYMIDLQVYLYEELSPNVNLVPDPPSGEETPEPPPQWQPPNPILPPTIFERLKESLKVKKDEEIMKKLSELPPCPEGDDSCEHEDSTDGGGSSDDIEDWASLVGYLAFAAYLSNSPDAKNLSERERREIISQIRGMKYIPESGHGNMYSDFRSFDPGAFKGGEQTWDAIIPTFFHELGHRSFAEYGQGEFLSEFLADLTALEMCEKLGIPEGPERDFILEQAEEYRKSQEKSPDDREVHGEARRLLEEALFQNGSQFTSASEMMEVVREVLASYSEVLTDPNDALEGVDLNALGREQAILEALFAQNPNPAGWFK